MGNNGTQQIFFPIFKRERVLFNKKPFSQKLQKLHRAQDVGTTLFTHLFILEQRETMSESHMNIFLRQSQLSRVMLYNTKCSFIARKVRSGLIERNEKLSKENLPNK